MVVGKETEGERERGEGEGEEEGEGDELCNKFFMFPF